MDLIETNSNYIVTSGSKSLYFDRLTGKCSVKCSSTVLNEWNPVCLGTVDGIIGKIRYDPDSFWRLFLIRNSEFIGQLPDGMEIRRVTRVIALPLSTQPTRDFQLKPCTKSHPEQIKRATTGSSSNLQNPLIGQVRRHLRNAAGTVDANLTHERQREKYERRIHEELSRLLHMEEEAFFYFSPGGGDVTSWTQRKHSSTYWTGLRNPVESMDSESSDTDWVPQRRPTWRQPVWRRADARFFWNSHILAEAIQDADRILRSQGFPDYGGKPSPEIESGVFDREISDLDSLIMPIIQGYVEMEKLSLFPTPNNITVFPQKQPAPLNEVNSMTSTTQTTGQRGVTVYYSPSSQKTNMNNDHGTVVFHGLGESPSELNHDLSTNLQLSRDLETPSHKDGVPEWFTTPVETVNETAQLNSSTTKNRKAPAKKQSFTLGEITVVLISRRSRFRAGTRYRRRGIDNDGYVANYVETEQILQTHTVDSPQTVAFLQIRGSVPLFWTQTGLKYRPPINLEKTDAENQAAFARHWQDLLSRFRQVVIVSLLDSGQNRSENILSEACLHHLLLYNSPKLTCVLFDFHDYCRNLRFENASVLLAGIMHLLNGMKFCWVSEQGLLCKQRWIFRVNCLDCLDRTNVVQCLFAEIAMATQLRKFGILGPDDHLPASFIRAMQRIWANNGDAISQQYAGTIAMKGDYTRTGERTMNGMMRDGVSSMNRYYLRFRELARQAAIDLFLGHDDSPELVLFRSGAGLKSASLQVREENFKTLIHRCRDMLLKPEEKGLSECLLITYSELHFDPQFVNTLLIVTDQYLHFIRTDGSTKSRCPVYVRIPVNAIERLELGLEPSVFRSRYHVLRVFYKRPLPDEAQPVNLNEAAPISSAAGAVGITEPDDLDFEFPPSQLAGSNPELYESSASESARCPEQNTSDVELLESHYAERQLQQQQQQQRISQFLEQVDPQFPDPLNTEAVQSVSNLTKTTIVTAKNNSTTGPSGSTKPIKNTPPRTTETKPPSDRTEQQSRRTIRFSRPGSTARHFLAFTQPNVRLFNTVLVPVPLGDETVQALNVVAAMILVAVRSTNGHAELVEHPKRTKLERLRQAAVPQSYLPKVNSEQLFCDLLMEGWTRTGFSIRQKRKDKKSIEADDPSLSSDGNDLTESSRCRLVPTGRDMPSRVDRLRQRLNQIKLPDIRFRLGKRPELGSDFVAPNITDAVERVSANTEQPSAARLPVMADGTTKPSAALPAQERPSPLPHAQTVAQSEPSRLLAGLARFVQRPLVGGKRSDEPGRPQQIHSDASVSSDDGTPQVHARPSSAKNSGPSDWSQSENDLPIYAEGEESDRDRGYADDEYEEGVADDDDDDIVDDDVIDDDEEEEDASETEVNGTGVMAEANCPPEIVQPTLTVVPQPSHVRAMHQRSRSEVYTIQSTDERLGGGLQSFKYGDTDDVQKICRPSRVSQILREANYKPLRSSLPKLASVNRHRLMYERISSITGKAWQSGVLSQRDWQSELSLSTTRAPVSPNGSTGLSDLPQPTSSKRDAEITSSRRDSPAVTLSTTDKDANDELLSAEARASQYSLVRSDNMPEIVLDNARQVDRLRKKQLASLIRLDEIRHDTCPERAVSTRFLIF